MSSYLEEAAQLLRKAAEANERENGRYPGLAIPVQERLARQFAELAAIENGQLPASIVELILDRMKGEQK